MPQAASEDTKLGLLSRLAAVGGPAGVARPSSRGSDIASPSRTGSGSGEGDTASGAGGDLSAEATPDEQLVGVAGAEAGGGAEREEWHLAVPGARQWMREYQSISVIAKIWILAWQEIRFFQ